MKNLPLILASFALFSVAYGQIFEQMFGWGEKHQNSDPQPEENHFAAIYENADCNKYLCPDSLTCVENPINCPCPFPASQLKCPLPGGKTYVCISKPAYENPDGSSPYDVPAAQASKVRIPGQRDCGYVEKLARGEKPE